MKRFFYTAFVFVNFLVATGFLFALLSLFVSPETSYFFAFFGLVFPFWLIANLFFALFWLFKDRKKIWVSLVPLLLGINLIFSFFQFPFHRQEADEADFSVMSYNVRLFDLYDWTKIKGIKQKIIDLVKEEQPDILCFQEYLSSPSNTRIKGELNYPYSFEYTPTKNGAKSIGTAIFSKFKIIKTGRINFSNSNKNHAIFADIIVDDDTIRVYNAHLGSIHLDYKDYSFLSGENDKTPVEDIAPFKKLLARLKKGFVSRVIQSKELLAHIKKSTFPVVVGTDLNDTPVSYTYRQFSSVLKDSFREKGKGMGSTYIGSTFWEGTSWLRIDYIWHDKALECVAFHTLKQEYSDHRAIKGYYKTNSSK